MCRPALLAFYAFLLGLATTAHTPAQTALAPVELRISGPRLIRRGDNLEFKAVIVNHSLKPVAFPFRRGGWDCQAFSARPSPTSAAMCFFVWHEPERGMICCLTRGLSERDIVVLQAGEIREAPVPSDPSDIYAFPRKGFYHVTLQLVFDPSGQVGDPTRAAGPTRIWLARRA